VLSRQAGQFFQRQQHEGERIAELMADVGEELVLGPGQLGQRGELVLGVAAGVRGGEQGTHLVSEQVEELPVGIVERDLPADPGDQDSDRGPPLPGGANRQDHGGARRLRPRAGVQARCPRVEIIQDLPLTAIQGGAQWPHGGCHRG
jgi:hypothetical protein